MNFITKTVKHFNTIMRHKYWVFHYACKAGIPWRGLKHDMSKFSPTEFWESVKYFQGNRSPIDACKEKNGYSRAWLHHRGRNRHHYEYWTDNYDRGGEALRMPYKDAVEMLCDYLAAGRAYMKKDFSYEAEYKWWLKKKSGNIMMHPTTMRFITQCLERLVQAEGNKDKEKEVFKSLKMIYFVGKFLKETE